jgi:hypothetical protein
VDKLRLISIIVVAGIFFGCLFAPIVSINGPIIGHAKYSIADIVSDLASGEDEREKSTFEQSITNQINREISGIQIPVAGPALIVGSALALLVSYTAMMVSVWKSIKRHPSRVSHLAWAMGGIGFTVLFMLGCMETQSSLNRVDGNKLSHKIMSIISSSASRMYEIQWEWGCLVLGFFSVIMLLALMANRLWAKSTHV